MLLDALVIDPRLREPWAALDLGVPIAKKHWGKYALIWLILASPIFVLLSITLPLDYLWLCPIIIWWLKPIFERPILYMLSKHLFGQKISIKETLKQYRGWMNTGWINGITIRRFSFARSFYMPVSLLEQLKGKQYSQRVNVLGNKGGNEAFWLTLTLIHIEMFLPFALLGLIALFYPVFNFDDLISAEQGFLMTTLTNTVSFFTMSIVAPFYTSCGFMLYICRRIELEAWDIEISFQDLAKRLLKE